MFDFFTNYLEPLSYLLYFLAFLRLHLIRPGQGTRALLVYYALATPLMVWAAIYVGIGKNNTWMYNLLYFGAFSCISFYYYRQFRSARKKMVALITAYLSLGYFTTILLLGKMEFHSFGYSVFSILIVTQLFLFLHQLFTHITEEPLHRTPDFWILTGYLVLFLGNFLVYATFYYFTARILKTYSDEERRVLTLLWGVQNLVLFISSLITLIGSLWITYRRKPV